MLLVLAAATASRSISRRAARSARRARHRRQSTGARGYPELKARRHRGTDARRRPPGLLIRSAAVGGGEDLALGTQLSKKIVALAVPAIVNRLVLPINAGGRPLLGGPDGRASEAPARPPPTRCSSSAFWLVSFVPTITTPRVAARERQGRQGGGAARRRRSDLPVGLHRRRADRRARGGRAHGADGGGQRERARLLGAVPAVELPGVAPDAISTVGFAALSGVLDTVTPLKSVAANRVNVVLDPILIGNAGLGVAG